MGQYRYPGTRSFQTSEAPLFHGREGDILSLLRMIRLENLVVLYGKSGLGKSSLLNAGILPALGKELDGYAVEEIRFGARTEATQVSPLRVLEKGIWPEDLHPSLIHEAPRSDQPWLHAKSRALAGGSSHLFLVFDQFEELFSYPEPEVHHFRSALAALMQEGTPLWLRQELIRNARSGNKQLSQEERAHLLAPLEIKVLITVRSDRLSLLDQFTTHLPNILVNLYELKPLGAAASRRAILQPAQQTGEQFISPAFSYSPAATALILQSLSNEAGEIEPFQLQLLCQYLEEKVIETPTLSVIEPTDFGGEEGVRDILHSYYERHLGQLSADEQMIARRFIEEGLVVDGARAGMTAGSERKRFGVEPALLKKLLESRLIRTANIHLGKIYELSHDTLVEPVTRAKENRLAKEEQERIERELAAAEARNKEERRRRNRARWLAIIGFSLFTLAAISGLFAWQKYQQAERNQRKASAAALAAHSWEIYPQNHTLAFRLAEAALRIDPENAEVQQTLFEILNNPKTSFFEKVLEEHNFEVLRGEFTTDGKQYATCSHDQKVILWDSTGRVVHQFRGSLSGADQPGHSARVTDLAFTPDGKKLYSAAEDGYIKVWDTVTGELSYEWKAYEAAIRTITFDPGKNRLYTTADDPEIRIWTPSGELIQILSGHQGPVLDLELHPGGKLFATAGQDGLVILWSSDNGTSKRLRSTGQGLNALVFHNQEDQLFLARKDGLIELINFEGRNILSFTGHRGEVTDLSLFPHSPYMLSAGEDGIARVWTLKGEEMLALTGHQKELSFATISPNEQVILTGGFDFTAKLWDVAYNLGLQRNKHTDFIYGVDFSNDGKKMLTAGKDGLVKLWKPSGEWILDLQGSSVSFQSAFFIPGTEEVITADANGVIRIFNQNGQLEMQLEHTTGLNMARATTRREQIIAVTYDGQVLVWDKAGKLLHQWMANPSGKSVGSLDFHPDSKSMVTAQGNTVKIWDLQGNLQDSFAHASVNVIYRAFFHPDGNSIFTAAREFPIRQWSREGTLLKSFYGHGGENYWIAFPEDHSMFASASWDQTVKIWDISSGRNITTISHPNGVYAIAFSPTADTLITGSHDNIGRIWSAPNTLIGALGERVNINKASGSKHIAPLSGIPFSLTELELPERYLNTLAQDDPAQYQREAMIAFQRAQEVKFSLEQRLVYFEQALHNYQTAQQFLPPAERDRLDLNKAAVYEKIAEQYLIHQEYEKALGAVKKGLEFAERDYLLVFQTLIAAFQDRKAEVERLCSIYDGRPMPQIEWYTNFNEAVINDLAYFQSQFGLECPASDLLEESLISEE